MKILLCAALLLGWGSILCTAADIDESVEKLASAPAWCDMSRADLESQGPRLIEAYASIAMLDSAAVKEVVSRFLAKYPPEKHGLAPACKIYVFNRYYFNVQQGVVRTSFGGNWIKEKDDPLTPIWPLAELDNGEIAVKYSLAAYSGPLYRGMEEFEFFEKVFKKRRTPPTD